MKLNKWRTIKCLSSQLQLSATLTGGQSFRWKKYTNTIDPEVDDNTYLGVIANCLWLLKQTENELLYKIIDEISYEQYKNLQHNVTPSQKKKKVETNNVEDEFEIRMKVPYPNSNETKNTNLCYDPEYYDKLLFEYFRLDINLEEYYKTWCNSNEHFQTNSNQFYAVRMLNQDPIENIFSFICSQNNNISRISGLVEKLCTNYGTKICEFENTIYYAFPDVISLSHEEVESELRTFGFGYRAKYIQKSAKEIISKGGLIWLKQLQIMNYHSAHTELMTLTGIGPKVADCICLMSLNHLDAIPVDTHVFQLAQQYYIPQLGKTKTVTTKIYNQIGDKFREIYGPLAGWAQTVLFCSDLKRFKGNEIKKKKTM